MPTARELLEQVDALMRRNRGVPSARVGAAPEPSRPGSGSPRGAPFDALLEPQGPLESLEADFDRDLAAAQAPAPAAEVERSPASANASAATVDTPQAEAKVAFPPSAYAPVDLDVELERGLESRDDALEAALSAGSEAHLPAFEDVPELTDVADDLEAPDTLAAAEAAAVRGDAGDAQVERAPESAASLEDVPELTEAVDDLQAIEVADATAETVTAEPEAVADASPAMEDASPAVADASPAMDSMHSQREPTPAVTDVAPPATTDDVAPSVAPNSDAAIRARAPAPEPTPGSIIEWAVLFTHDGAQRGPLAPVPVPAASTPAPAEVGPDASLDGAAPPLAEDERWRSLAEDIRMQVLQRIDIFTDTGLQAKLKERMQPIVDRASAELVDTINRQIGQLLREYVAEAVEREIDRWRNSQS